MAGMTSRICYLPDFTRDLCEKPQRRHRFYPPKYRRIEYKDPPDSEIDKGQSLEKWFNQRADRWASETGIHSSPVIRFMHKDYQSIMTRGMDVVPFILKRLRCQPDEWFWALRHIADHDAAENADSFNGAVAAWLRWGVDNGYIPE